MVSRSFGFGAALAIALTGQLAESRIFSQQPSEQFRSGVVLVPLDVRVTDRTGNPVTDLTARDFTILEDGVPQSIAHFSTRSLSADRFPSTTTSGLAPADTAASRTFAIVLGRGRLNTPVKALDALIDFVRNQIPTDRITLMAYLRATPILTEREPIIRLLEHFRARHDELDGRLSADMRINPNWIREETRTALDKFFSAPGLPEMRGLAGSTGDFSRV